MYTPSHYKNENLDEVREFLKQNSFGILINQTDGRPWATHIPMELDVDDEGKDILVGHISKANPQWKSFEGNEEVLAIFNGPHSYISSSWYKEEEVPTWNYIAVHVYGKIHILNDEAVLDSLHKLVDKYEKASTNPVSIHNLSHKTMRQIKGIVGFQIGITDIHATYKLSQTRPEDHPKIIEELQKTNNPGSHEIANMIKQKK
ncbi:FMN-binding negative transcriptional regulator [Arenibacter algicola]|uniref:Protease synthase and sporulation protein PAI 2 n=1 Tax=Arenibacter algicola TaxID=616991 RepID=A0A221V3K3_9FLAO|nr:FMN-binding negative transcriptional regulator [Arenibacter algicola]ASO08159.1 protease synthase and sporulation protein PAI 2 [Arenibacter algicola]|tara:strand:+ start:7113 stop:7721 length:609 start_codon:yes stop_codon:yes gene_type:complete